MIWHMQLARLITAGVALVVAAWFALGTRQARELDHAKTTISAASSLTAAQAARVDSMLDAAGTLNPDQEVNVLRARLALLKGDRPEAVRILERLVRGEPMNIEGWVFLAQAGATDRAILGQALLNIRRLDHVGSHGL
jgi:predicted Zn-dependent protease